MVFSSTTFLFLFLPSLMLVYYGPHSLLRHVGKSLPRRVELAWKNTVLLLVSLFFYAWGEPRFVFI